MEHEAAGRVVLKVPDVAANVLPEPAAHGVAGRVNQEHPERRGRDPVNKAAPPERKQPEQAERAERGRERKNLVRVRHEPVPRQRTPKPHRGRPDDRDARPGKQKRHGKGKRGNISALRQFARIHPHIRGDEVQRHVPAHVFERAVQEQGRDDRENHDKGQHERSVRFPVHRRNEPVHERNQCTECDERRREAMTEATPNVEHRIAQPLQRERLVAQGKENHSEEAPYRYTPPLVLGAPETTEAFITSAIPEFTI